MHAPTNSGVDAEVVDDGVDDLLKGSLLTELNGTHAHQKAAIAHWARLNNRSDRLTPAGGLAQRLNCTDSP
ncbi:MAG: hypothetical protein KME14_16050 [Tildeniella torsiva UHER 1998/13D]|nr:hypothetical protein [Tildeniella torsiva UHER 1998/13D]